MPPLHSRDRMKHPDLTVSSLDRMSHQILRIIDASMNRIGEGLRLLEDVARLLLDGAALTEQFKTMRHDLLLPITRDNAGELLVR